MRLFVISAGWLNASSPLTRLQAATTETMKGWGGKGGLKSAEHAKPAPHVTNELFREQRSFHVSLQINAPPEDVSDTPPTPQPGYHGEDDVSLLRHDTL